MCMYVCTGHAEGVVEELWYRTEATSCGVGSHFWTSVLQRKQTNFSSWGICSSVHGNLSALHGREYWEYVLNTYPF